MIDGQLASVSSDGDSWSLQSMFWSASYVVLGGSSGGDALVSVGFADIVGNAGADVSATTDGSAVTLDLTAQSVTIAGQTATVFGGGVVVCLVRDII